MPLFAVIPLGNNRAALRDALSRAQNPIDHLALQNGAGFLVNFHGTSVELSHALGISDPDKQVKSLTGSALVVSIGSYYGRGPTTMWEWIQTRLEGGS
jgi:hypothetical protein